MTSFDHPWDWDPKKRIISASPSATHPGGTVYFYEDGTRREVFGGKGAAYRANSPGFNIPVQYENGDGDVIESDDHYHGRIEAMIKRYGAIGSTLSKEGQPQLVFGNAAAAAKGLLQRLDEINSQSSGKTVLDVLTDYNGGGHGGGPVGFQAYATSVFQYKRDGFGDQSALLKRPWNSLSDAERATVINKTMRVEGYDAPQGAQISPLLPPDPKFILPPPPWQKSEYPAASSDSLAEEADGATADGQIQSTQSPSALRRALEQRAAGLGIDYIDYLPNSALLRRSTRGKRNKRSRTSGRTPPTTSNTSSIPPAHGCSPTPRPTRRRRRGWRR